MVNLSPPVTGPQLAEGCPWSTWMPPNLAWCEERLCQWIVTPANAWSNLAYLVAAAWIAYEVKKRKESGVLKLYAPAALIVGTSSFIYHASYTFFFQVFDFFGMYLFIFLPLVTQLRSLSWIEEKNTLPIYIGGSLFFTALTVAFYFLGVPAQALIALLILIIITLESIRRSNRRAQALSWNGHEFAIGLGFLVSGAALSALDISGKFCEPTNHWLQGHSLWHICTAITVIFVYRHFRYEAVQRSQ